MSRPLRVLVVGPKFASTHSRGGMAEVVALMRRCPDDRVRIRTVATYIDDPRSLRLLAGVLGAIHSALLVLARRVDVLHVHLAHRGSVLRKSVPLLAARIAGTPAVVHAHSHDFAGWFDQLPPLGRFAVRRLLAADRWYVLGDGLAAEYRERLLLDADRVRVLRNPAAPSAPGPDRGAEGPVHALSLGRLGRRKGSYDLVAALAMLDPATRARLRVTLAGDGEVQQVRDAARRADVVEVLDVRSWVDVAERDALLARSAIFALPSYDEGLPLALLEAMAAGLAPVCTPVGGIPEVVRDGVDALFVAPGDVPALAAALASLVADASLRVRLGDAARVRAADFGVEAWYEELITDWQRLAARR